MKHRQKKRIKSTVTEKYHPSCFVEGIPKDWNENQVKTACPELDMDPLHFHMGLQKGTGMLFSFQVVFLLFYPTSLSIDFQCLAIITFGNIHVEVATHTLSDKIVWEGRYIKAKESSGRPTPCMNNCEKARLRMELKKN